jgi:hypothetical protein|uniref:START domain-containing protein n=1 Tax=Phaeodactylum tricornutum TaxID=2850 RepID=A0A8J9S2M3_PHATR
MLRNVTWTIVLLTSTFLSGVSDHGVAAAGFFGRDRSHAPQPPSSPDSSGTGRLPTHSRPERGKLIGNPIHVEDLHQAFIELQADYARKALYSNGDNEKEATRWRVLNNRDGVEVAILEHPSDPACPYVRMKARIPVSVQSCWDFLRVSEWDRTMPKMDPFYEGVSVHGEWVHRKTHMILCRKRMRRIGIYGKRDLVFLSVTDVPLRDGTLTSGTVSVRTNKVPRVPGYTRCFQDSIAFYKPVNNDSQTDLTIVCRIDLNDSAEDGMGGLIPMWFYVKTIGITGVQSVVRMREALVQEQTERLSGRLGE